MTKSRGWEEKGTITRDRLYIYFGNNHMATDHHNPITTLPRLRGGDILSSSKTIPAFNGGIKVDEVIGRFSGLKPLFSTGNLSQSVPALRSSTAPFMSLPVGAVLKANHYLPLNLSGPTPTSSPSTPRCARKDPRLSFFSGILEFCLG